MSIENKFQTITQPKIPDTQSYGLTEFHLYGRTTKETIIHRFLNTKIPVAEQKDTYLSNLSFINEFLGHFTGDDGKSLLIKNIPIVNDTDTLWTLGVVPTDAESRIKAAQERKIDTGKTRDRVRVMFTQEEDEETKNLLTKMKVSYVNHYLNVDDARIHIGVNVDSEGQQSYDDQFATNQYSNLDRVDADIEEEWQIGKDDIKELSKTVTGYHMHTNKGQRPYIPQEQQPISLKISDPPSARAMNRVMVEIFGIILDFSK